MSEEHTSTRFNRVLGVLVAIAVIVALAPVSAIPGMTFFGVMLVGGILNYN